MYSYQGQYEDVEIGLYYNRFRYYDPEQGNYTQVDPIGLAGGNPTLYGYVSDCNSQFDPFGLWSIMDEIPSFQAWQRHHIIPKSLGGYGKTGFIHDAIRLSGIDVDKISRNVVHLPMFEGMDPNRSLHNGYNQVHLKYNEYVGKELDRILKEGKALNAGDLFYKNRVNDLMDDLRKGLMSGEIKCG
ncbi:RHS repeat-associated core domain-containing protein [Lysinibacillus sp. NPDC056185]|uniref:RHS repeat-associated core domain-containing protein n=1 Tax=Lysinibacillus sp. NPDC056185 TaxID=3345739 RepID=UPI0039F09F4B